MNTAIIQTRRGLSCALAIRCSAAQFGALIHAERLRYEKLVREAGIKPD